MNDIEEAIWNAAGLDPQEKLVLLALARGAYHTAGGTVAIAGMRALRTMAGMGPAELDQILESLQGRGLIAKTDDKAATGRAAMLERGRTMDGPWKAWRLGLEAGEEGR